MDATPNEARYRIGYVSRATGLSVHTLRMWERRYGVVVPERTGGGGRLYKDADVARLSLIRRLVSEGHSIGTVASLSTEELERILVGTQSSIPEPVSPNHELGREFIDAIRRLDMGSAQQILTRGAVALEPRTFVLGVVAPVLTEIGELWEAGELRIVHEHAATQLLRSLIISLSRVFPPGATSRVAVVATLSEERHELGALIVAMLASMHGWKVVFLGSDLPHEEIAEAARQSTADLVLLSIVQTTARGVAELGLLEQILPKSSRLIVGGRGADGLSLARADVMGTDELEAVLIRGQTPELRRE